MNSASAFAEMIRTVHWLGENSSATEPVAKIWELTFWLALLYNSRSPFPGISKSESFPSADLQRIMQAYCSGLGADGRQTTAQFLMRALQFFKRKNEESGGTPEIIPDFMLNFEVDGKCLEELIERLHDALVERDLSALLTIDSLDSRVDSLDKYDVQRNEARLAITGLLKCLGAFSKTYRRYSVRFCLPSERKFQFLTLSSNPTKDFVDSVELNWHAGELACIAADRLKLFMGSHVEYSGHASKHFGDPKRRGDAIAILENVLGRSVMNLYEQEEDSISYIMRHTQLLPRHVLLFLNSIFVVQHERRESLAKIQGRSIREGINKVEEIVCHEIFTAYKHIHPQAEAVCAACIPDLHTRFGYGELHEVFNRHGKRTMASEDFDEFKRMLIEVGIVGKVLNETDRYVIGGFEYAAGHRLVMGTSDEMCLHPVFTHIHSAKRSDPPKPIYPKGSDAESEDEITF